MFGSATISQTIRWMQETNDNRTYRFLIIDKQCFPGPLVTKILQRRSRD